MTKPIFPDREYFRLSTAAQTLGCAEEELLHMAATHWIELCAPPPTDMVWCLTLGDRSAAVDSLLSRVHYLEHSKVSQIIQGKELNNIWGDFDFEEGSFALLRGPFAINFLQLQQVEMSGAALWSDPCNGQIYLSGMPEQGHWFYPVTVSEKRIAIEDLVITRSEYERVKDILHGGAKKRLPDVGALLSVPHPSAERFAVNREQVLKAAIYCKEAWPEQCKTYRAWAELVDQKAQLFWPETGEPPLKPEQIERLIGRACKIAADGE